MAKREHRYRADIGLLPKRWHQLRAQCDIPGRGKTPGYVLSPLIDAAWQLFERFDFDAAQVHRFVMSTIGEKKGPRAS